MKPNSDLAELGSHQRLSTLTPEVRREPSDEASRRARISRITPQPADVDTMLKRYGPIIGRRGADLANRHLPRLLRKHPVGAVVSLFLAGAIIGRMAFVRR